MPYGYPWWQFGAPPPTRFTPGGGTFPDFPGTSGAGNDFPERPRIPFGQPGPGYQDDLGHPMHPMPGFFGPEITDPYIDPTMTQGADPRMVFNPDNGFPLGLGGPPMGLGGEPKVYDPGEMSRLVESLRTSSPESLPNPAPNEQMDAYNPYGTAPNIPTYELPPMQFQDLYNPNTGATNFPFDVRDFPSGMETINWTPPPGMPPGQDLNFPASDIPNIPGGGDVSAGELTNPPPDLGYNPPPNETMYPGYTDTPGGAQPYFYPDAGDIASGNFQWPFYIDQFPEDTGDSASYPTPPGVTPDVLPAQNIGVPRAYYGPGANIMQSPGNIFPGQQPIATGQPAMLDANGNPIPGTGLSPTDEASMYNRGPISPLDPSLLDQLKAPTDWKNAGKLFRDAAGNILNAAGKVIGTIGDLARGAGNLGRDFINNIMNEPGYSDPGYLRSIGYNPGQGTGSLFPASVTGPTSGALDVGNRGIDTGSFFHGSQYTPGGIDPTTGQPVTDRPASPMNPSGYNYPTHGATSVTGAFTNLGGMGTHANITALGGDAYARHRMQQLARSTYRAPGGQLMALSLTPNRALVGGAPGSVFSPWMQRQYPMTPAGPGGVPVRIVNPSALGGNVPERGGIPGRPSIHFNPRSTP